MQIMRGKRLMLVVVAVTGATMAAMASRAEPVREADSNTPAKAPAVKKAGLAYKSVLIREVPHVKQKPDFCGEAIAAGYLQKLGRPVDQDYVFDQAGLDPLLARGCFTKELATALKNIGFDLGPVWYKISADRHAEQLQSHFQAIHTDLVAGAASIVCMHYDDRPKTTEHFRLILGYDADTDEVIYHEPAEADGAYRRMTRATFLKLWPLKYDSRQWTLVRMRLVPKVLRQGKASETFTSADYAQHLMQLKNKIPSDRFTIVLQPPFVVIGDESPAMVKSRAEGTVKWSVDRLKEAYFTKDPTEILDIWLFKDEVSYQKHTKQIFNHRPSTPYGYFSSSDGALVMDIHTGGGTLVHEIVHPLMASNFPSCPAWFNEGLGSLYEQSGTLDGRIVGKTNWRLAGLQTAIRNKSVPTFRTLCTTTEHQFYRMDEGTNYAHARYLCYYLQQRGLLRTFYHRFHADQKKDPTGYDTLRAVLDCDDMAGFQRDWEAYVMKLRFLP